MTSKGSLAEFITVVDIMRDPKSAPDAATRAKTRAMEILNENGLRQKARGALGWDGMTREDEEDMHGNVTVAALEELNNVDVHRDDYGDGGNDPIKHIMDIAIKKGKSINRRESQKNVTYRCSQCNKSFSFSAYVMKLKRIVHAILKKQGHPTEKLHWLSGKKLVQQAMNGLYGTCPDCGGKVVTEAIYAQASAFEDEDGSMVEFESDSSPIRKYRTKMAIVTSRDRMEKAAQLEQDRREFERDVEAIKREFSLPALTCEIMDLIFKEQIMFKRLHLSAVKNREVRKRIQKTGKDFTDNYFLVLMERYDKSNIQPILKHIDRIRDAVNSYYGADVWARIFGKPTTDEIFRIEYSFKKRTDTYVKIGTGKFIKIEDDLGLVEIVYNSDYVTRHHIGEQQAVIEVERVEKFKKWVIVDEQHS